MSRSNKPDNNPKFAIRSRKTSRDRSSGTVNIRPAILIVCQGEKTEPGYFNAFRRADVEVVHGNGSPLRVVEYAEKLWDGRPGKRDEQVWCVFDKDDFKDFDAAIARIATLNGQGQPFFGAWSNECFEYWCLLHFDFLQSAIGRTACFEKLANHLGISYKKNDPLLRDYLRPHEETALENAKKLRKMHDDAGCTKPSEQCPMTNVDLLVTELRKSRL